MFTAALIGAGILGVHAFFIAIIIAMKLGMTARCGETPEGEMSASHPAVRVIVPVFNEARLIEGTLRHICRNLYPNFGVTVVDDGSVDETASIVARFASEEPRVRLIRLEKNQGKVQAPNVGIASADADVIVMIDADTLVGEGFIATIVGPIVAGRAHGVAGNVRVASPEKLIERLQSIEYDAILNATRHIQSLGGTVTTIPGAAGAVLRSVLLEVGTFSKATTAEDTDMTLSLTDAHHRVVYEEAAEAWTHVPSDLRALYYQRRRWFFGNVQCICRHSGRFHPSNLFDLFGGVSFVYENTAKPVFELVIIAAILLLALTDTGMRLLAFGVFALKLAKIMLFRPPQSRSASAVLYGAIFILLWPLLHIWPFSGAIAGFVSGARVPWRQPHAENGSSAVANPYCAPNDG